MFDTMRIIVASAIIGLIYFLLDADWNFWIYVAIYSLVHMIFSIVTAVFYINLGASIWSMILYVFLNVVIYTAIGIGVVFALRSTKNDYVDPKMTIGIGVVAQIGVSLILNDLFGNLISIF